MIDIDHDLCNQGRKKRNRKEILRMEARSVSTRDTRGLVSARQEGTSGLEVTTQLKSHPDFTGPLFLVVEEREPKIIAGLEFLHEGGQ